MCAQNSAARGQLYLRLLEAALGDDCRRLKRRQPDLGQVGEDSDDEADLKGGEGGRTITLTSVIFMSES